MIAARHIIRPTAAGLVQTASSSIRLRLGALPLVEFFFAYPGLGQLLLSSLGVNNPGALSDGAAVAHAKPA
jgi:ABC-type dipeptide/oligopeptide/nickel transport system permease component